MLDKSKFKLNPDDQIKFKSKREKGHLGQTEIWTYDILDKDGNVIGSIKETEHTNVRGLNSYKNVVQYNSEGEIVFEDKTEF